MLIGFDVAAPLVDVEVDVDVAVVRKRREMLPRIVDARAVGGVDVGGGDGASLRLRHPKDGLFDIVGKAQGERLQVADDLMDVFHDAGDGLMLMDDAVDSEARDGGAAEGRQQHAPHGVAEGVAVAALERLEPELGDERVVFALRGFYKLRTNEPAEIDGLGHVFSVLKWSYRMRSGIALPRPLRAASSNGGKGSDPLLFVITSEARDLLLQSQRNARGPYTTNFVVPFNYWSLAATRLVMTFWLYLL